MRNEVAEGSAELPLLRSAVLESVRLWPTTLAILRETTSPIRRDGHEIRAGTTFVIVSAFFHRAPATVPFAHRFDPQAWLDGRADELWSLVPFSAGSGACPGRNLVLLVTSTVLAALLEDTDLRPSCFPTASACPTPSTAGHCVLPRCRWLLPID